MGVDQSGKQQQTAGVDNLPGGDVPLAYHQLIDSAVRHTDPTVERALLSNDRGIADKEVAHSCTLESGHRVD
ncbi:hypothetical protein Q1M64_06130 (plasmid) [Sinorhizobium meliloti]|nr:hypothetical protein Q1M64_06130 [Sinorhizobium meliloti]